MKRSELLEEFIKRKPVRCSKCGGKLFYVAGGQYECQDCEHEEYDDFGKVKLFIDENGPSPALLISEGTGVSEEVINLFLKKGRLEIPEGSDFYLSCEKCGCSIRYGRFCPNCIKQLSGGIRGLLVEDEGERPKSGGRSGGKMHFADQWDRGKKR